MGSLRRLGGVERPGGTSLIGTLWGNGMSLYAAELLSRDWARPFYDFLTATRRSD